MEVVIHYVGGGSVAISKVGPDTSLGMVKDALNGRLGTKQIDAIIVRGTDSVFPLDDDSTVEPQEERRKPESRDLRDRLASMRTRLREDDEVTLDRVIALISMTTRNEHGLVT